MNDLQEHGQRMVDEINCLGLLGNNKGFFENMSCVRGVNLFKQSDQRTKHIQKNKNNKSEICEAQSNKNFH